MENTNNNLPWEDRPINGPTPGTVPPVPERPRIGFPTEKKELFFALLAMVCSLMLCNFVIFGGFELGFGIAMCATILCGSGYLLASGCRLNGYGTVLLLLSAVICAGFGRSDDGFVKFVMLCFLTLSVNLGFCLTAAQNRRSPGGAGSLLDAGRTVFTMGYGQLPKSLSGLFGALKSKGSPVKTAGSVLLGGILVLPLLAVVLFLLKRADAAFENMMKISPQFRFGQTMATVFFGVIVFCVLYTRVVALARRDKDPSVTKSKGSGFSKITVNTVLLSVSLVYLLYLVSQLAYLAGGFAGIVPEGYTLAEYARRGFFEMAWLCAINIGVIVVSVTLVFKNDGRAPLSTRLLCLFIGLVTLFIVTAASAKMLVYIGGYGLTRLRVMTQLIIIFFGLTALTVSISLFLKKPRYMPVLIIGALLLGGAAFWVDVDTVVATYNVGAYQAGILETVDVEYLGTLSNGAVPQIAKLVDDKDPEVAEAARQVLENSRAQWKDFRDWNFADWQAKQYLSQEDSEA